jgi:ribulose-5-phosphate 4-epimerase/fuculose-1-phosphate aldolase
VSETGVVKFRCEQIPAALAEFPGFVELNACRRKLRELGMIGVDGNGIGYGNLSVRDRDSGSFYITGSGTGGLADLTPNDCARVVSFELETNWLRAEGAVSASSESLTHAVIYMADASARAVIHCHSPQLWTQLRATAPSTSPQIAYGTPEMARAVQRLFTTTDVKTRKVFAMAGHEDGVVAFGVDFNEALAALGC